MEFTLSLYDGTVTFSVVNLFWLVSAFHSDPVLRPAGVLQQSLYGRGVEVRFL